MNQTVYDYWNVTFTKLLNSVSTERHPYPSGAPGFALNGSAAVVLQDAVPTFSQALDANSPHYMGLNAADTQSWSQTVPKIIRWGPDHLIDSRDAMDGLQALQTILNNNKQSLTVGMKEPISGKAKKHHKKKAA